jgi:hypothetical protein
MRVDKKVTQEKVFQESKPKVAGLDITLSVLENIHIGNQGGTLTANPHNSDTQKKMKIGIYINNELVHVVEGQGRAWMMGQLQTQLCQFVVDSEWARVI